MEDIKIYEEFIIQNQKNERFKILSKNLNFCREYPWFLFSRRVFKAKALNLILLT